MIDEKKIKMIRDYLESIAVEKEVYTPWVEGFLCGLVKMEGWAITEEEHDELMLWLQHINWKEVKQ